MAGWLIAVIVIGGLLLAVAVYDVTQRRHTILANFPIIGHFRYLLESIGPELRQYIVTSNDEERPFNRAQRRWVYASAKRQNPNFGFGTDQDLDQTGYLIIKHSAFPWIGEIDEAATLPCAKELGAWRDRPGPVPAGVGGEHLGHELRLAQRPGGRGAERRRPAGRLPAEHRRGRHLQPSTATAASSSTRSAPGTSAAATPTAPSACRGCRRRSRGRRSGPSRSSSARGPSPAWAACCPG